MSRDLSALVDIFEAITLIEQYMNGVDQASFEANVEKQDAILRRITIIGEATKRLTKEFRAKHPSLGDKSLGCGMFSLMTMTKLI